MLINLTKITWTTSGIQGRVDNIKQTPIWINTNQIISIDLITGPEQYPNTTRIFLTHNHQITVLEAPSEIISLIRGKQS